MKIGIYSPYLDTLTGGEKYIFTAASCLSNSHKVHIFWNDPNILSRAEAKFGLDLSRVELRENIFDKNVSLFKRLLVTKSYSRILYLSDGSIPLVASRKLMLHFQFPVEWVNTNSFVYLFKKLFIAKIICNSYFTKGFIDKKFSTESAVLYPPATQSVRKKANKENVILTVGRFSLLPNGENFKKLDILINSFKEFQKKRLKGWRLIVVTSVNEDLKKEFEDFKKTIKSNYIQVLENPNFEEISEVYSKAKIYWHAAGYRENLVKNPERAEHFGMSTVEAMSHGAVPVVINAGGQTEIVKDGYNGYLWNSVDELVTKTHQLARDHAHMSELSKQAIIDSQNFSKERFCEELNHLIW